MFYLTAGEFGSFYTKALLAQSGNIRNTILKNCTEIRLILTLGGVDYICAKLRGLYRVFKTNWNKGREHKKKQKMQTA
jgi:hypothetical protein